MNRIDSLPRVTLWIVRVLAWLLGAAGIFMVLMTGALATGLLDGWLLADLPAGAEADAVRAAFLVLLPLAALAIGVGTVFLLLLERIVKSVGDGDPFIHANAVRLKWMAAYAAAFQALALLVTWAERGVARAIGEPVMPFDPDIAGFVLALVLLVLAQVFDRGATMRDDLEGTV